MTQVRKNKPAAIVKRRKPSSAAPLPATPRLAAACCSPVDDLLDPELFKAFSDPTRVLLLACIAKCGRPCSVGEVAECCSVDLSVVSRHLTLLARAGVLESSKQGRTVHYTVRYDHLCRSLRSLADALESCSPATASRTRNGASCGCC
jgi:DNA-binding transcriptional ArsR family regulator